MDYDHSPLKDDVSKIVSEVRDGQQTNSTLDNKSGNRDRASLSADRSKIRSVRRKEYVCTRMY